MEGHHDLRKRSFVINFKEVFVLCNPLHLREFEFISCGVFLLCSRISRGYQGSSPGAQHRVETQHVTLSDLLGLRLVRTVGSLGRRRNEGPLSPPSINILPLVCIQLKSRRSLPVLPCNIDHFQNNEDMIKQDVRIATGSRMECVAVSLQVPGITRWLARAELCFLRFALRFVS